jgi:hypothetical protein
MHASRSPADAAGRPVSAGATRSLEMSLRRKAPLLLLLGCTLLLPVVAIALQRSALMAGDAPFYLAMQQAFLHHGSFSLPPDIQHALGQATGNPGLVGEGRVIRGPDGETYPVHFWFYPLLSVPFAAVLGALRLSPAYGFVALNILLFLGAAWVLHRSTVLGQLGKGVVLLSFAATTINWYVAWPHPEVYTACLLLVASLAALERRHASAALAAAFAALQNPSAILMIGGIGLIILSDALATRRQRPVGTLLLVQGAWLVPGLAVASLPYVYSLALLGVANPIVANAYVDPGQITTTKLASLLFDPNQGMAVGFPFVLTVLLVIVTCRVAQWFRNGAVPIRSEDALLVALIAMALPVLGQVNFNAGQYYVSRYVAWLGVPGIVWTAMQADRCRPALVAYVFGMALYVVNFCLFFAQKVHFVLTYSRAGGPVYEDQLIFKPLAAVLLALWPGLYTPWPEIFVERVVGREAPHLAPRPAEFDIVGYGPTSGTYSIVMTTIPDALIVGRRLCGEDWRMGERVPVFVDAGAGYFVTRSGITCRQAD